MNSGESGNLINHQNMNWGQFKYCVLKGLEVRIILLVIKFLSQNAEKRFEKSPNLIEFLMKQTQDC